jgi:hypothetical protein
LQTAFLHPYFSTHSTHFLSSTRISIMISLSFCGSDTFWKFAHAIPWQIRLYSFGLYTCCAHQAPSFTYDSSINLLSECWAP